MISISCGPIRIVVILKSKKNVKYKITIHLCIKPKYVLLSIDRQKCNVKPDKLYIYISFSHPLIESIFLIHTNCFYTNVWITTVYL